MFKREAMFKREPGYYWIRWTELVDADLAARKPGPLIAQWDGEVWWLVRSDVYRFDCEVEVLGGRLAPPQQSFLRAVPAGLAAHG
jgi:hypothetical protein